MTTEHYYNNIEAYKFLSLMRTTSTIDLLINAIKIQDIEDVKNLLTINKS